MGHGRHGKDTVCEYLTSLGYRFSSASQFLSEYAFVDLGKKYGYKDADECYRDRHNHRKEWHQIIAKVNKLDASFLGRLLFKKSDIYCGLRSQREFEAMRSEGLFDYIIWVDACRRSRLESKESFDICRPPDAILLDNNGDFWLDTVPELHRIINGIEREFGTKR